MRFLKTLGITTAIAAMVLASSAMAAPVKIALVVKSLGNGFFDAANKGAQEAAKALGDVDVIYTGPTKATAEAQIEVINSLIDQAKKESDVNKAAQIWTQIDKKVAELAVYLPFVFDKALNYRNPRMTNVFVNGYFGMWDFSALGVS